MRTFIGIDFDFKIKDRICSLQFIVRENSKKGRFKYIDNFHLTLKFLGEINIEEIPIINQVLENSAQKVGPFQLKVNKLGFFGGESIIRTLWLGLDGDLESLINLYEEIEDGLGSFGYKKEKRPYTPHITIAQDLLLNIDFKQLERLIDLSTIPVIDVNEVSLIKSEQIKGKRVYTPISTYRLMGKKEINRTKAKKGF
ncbi:MAG TPA: RNA 2',3'-cyclic phosphodiesterase [Clostridiales bacterium]|nr:RNA 2',3'-cyclic phosphodiesterase [Clostridiales bacterium]